MNNKTSTLRILLVIFSLLLLSFLVMMSFVVPKNYSVFDNKVTKVNDWYFLVKKSWDSNFVSSDFQNTGSGFSQSWAFVENVFGLFNSSYFYWDIYKNVSKWNKFHVEVWNWIYVFDFKDLSKTLEISWSWFVVRADSPWIFLINTTNVNKYSIFSINSNLGLDFLWSDKKVTSKSYLFPKMYLAFNKDILSKEFSIDELRMSQIADLGFFPESIESLETNPSYINLIFSWDTYYKSIFNDILAKIKIDFTNYNSELVKLQKNTFWSIFWVEFDKYYFLFVNNKKKLVLYKNMVLSSLTKLITSKNNDEINSNLENIINYSNKIKYISYTDYSEITNFINYYSNTSFRQFWEEEINTLAKTNFLKLVSKLNNKNISSEDLEKVSLGDTFLSFDFWGNSNIYAKLSVFLEKNARTLLSQKNLELKKYYLSLYIQKVVATAFTEDKTVSSENFDKILNILNIYILLNSNNETDSTRAKTTIISNLYILNPIKKYIKSSIFEEERSSEDTLKLKDQTELNLAYNKSFLISTINSLILYYDNNKSFLDENIGRDKLFKKSYESLKLDYKELFSAIDDYDAYLKDYSKLNQELLSAKTLNDYAQEEVSNQALLNYLSKFNGVNLSSLEMEIVENYYKVKSIWIAWNSFSFDLYPRSDNKIKNIKALDEFQAWSKDFMFYNSLSKSSYTLDNIEEESKDLIEKLDLEEAEKYKFENFFLNKFFPQVNNNIITYDDEQVQIIKEDPVVSVFKKVKLLWKKWEFSKLLNWILDLKYEDLFVEKKLLDYSIEIKKSKLNILLGEDRTKYQLDFSSSYKLNENSHYFFNSSFVPYIMWETDRSSIIWDNRILLLWKINLVQLESTMQEVLSDIWNLQIAYNSLSSKVWTVKISYNLLTKTYNLSWANINLIISWNNIKSLSINWSFVNVWNYKVSDLDKLLK